MHEAMAIATIPAKDIARARAFYAEKLGLEPAREEGPEALAYEMGKGTGFLLYQSQFAGTNQATTMSFEVSDFDGTMEQLRSKGVAFEDYDFPGLKTENGVATMPDGTKTAWFKDSEGNILALGNQS